MIDSHLRQPRVYHRDQFTTFVVPGRLRAWNAVDIDFGALGHQTDFTLGPGAHIVFNVIGAVHQGAPHGVSGQFGGVDVLNSGVADRPL
jgi:hypothetical protein